VVEIHDDVKTNDEVTVHPLLHNASFAQGQAYMPVYSRIAPCLGTRFQTRAKLQGLLFGRLATYHGLFKQPHPSLLWAKSLAELISEYIVLGWPPHWVSKSLSCWSHVHRGPWPNVVRKCGTVLRRVAKTGTIQTTLALRHASKNQLVYEALLDICTSVVEFLR
jgi:hypothetical protein